MEWYESLFLQVCAYMVSRARTVHLRREDEQLVATENDSKGLIELVASYPRNEDLRLVFDAADVRGAFARGADFVLLVQARDKFLMPASERVAERSKGQVRQVATASFEVGPAKGAWRTNHFDVVLCRRS